MNVEKQQKRSTTWNICIKLVVTWPWELGCSSATKVHKTCHLQTLCKRVLKWDMQNIRPLTQKNVACGQEKLCGGGLPQVRSKTTNKNNFNQDPRLGQGNSRVAFFMCGNVIQICYMRVENYWLRGIMSHSLNKSRDADKTSVIISSVLFLITKKNKAIKVKKLLHVLSTSAHSFVHHSA